MAGVCERCGQPLPDMRHGVRLTPLKARIFDAVKRAGPDGITGADLFALIYADQQRKPARESLVSHIWQINDALGEAGAGRIVTEHTKLFRFVPSRKAAAA